MKLTDLGFWTTLKISFVICIALAGVTAVMITVTG